MNGFLVGENSPSLCPTISSFISTSWYTLPLYTWNLSPTKLGNIVAERACVRMGGALFPGSGRTIGRLRARVLAITARWSHGSRGVVRGLTGRCWVLAEVVSKIDWNGGQKGA